MTFFAKDVDYSCRSSCNEDVCLFLQLIKIIQMDIPEAKRTNLVQQFLQMIRIIRMDSPEAKRTDLVQIAIANDTDQPEATSCCIEDGLVQQYFHNLSFLQQLRKKWAWITILLQMIKVIRLDRPIAKSKFWCNNSLQMIIRTSG